VKGIFGGQKAKNRSWKSGFIVFFMGQDGIFDKGRPSHKKVGSLDKIPNPFLAYLNVWLFPKLI